VTREEKYFLRPFPGDEPRFPDDEPHFYLPDGWKLLAEHLLSRPRPELPRF
jgi:hypothetical protein